MQALQVLYSEREVGGEVGLPRHWMRDFFLASLCLETQENQEGLSRLQVGSALPVTVRAAALYLCIFDAALHRLNNINFAKAAKT